MTLKRWDATTRKEGNLVSVDFANASRKTPQNRAMKQALFTEQELAVLDEIFQQGRQAGIFNRSGVSSDRCDLQEYALFDDREDSYAFPVFSLYKGRTEEGIESYATRSCMEEEPRIFPFFNMAAHDLACRVEQIVEKEMTRKNLALRTARLGQAPAPLRLVPSLKKPD